MWEIAIPMAAAGIYWIHWLVVYYWLHWSVIFAGGCRFCLDADGPCCYSIGWFEKADRMTEDEFN